MLFWLNHTLLPPHPFQPTPNREPSSSLEWPRCEGGRQSQPITMDSFSATHLTPMQRQLMEMFVASGSHRLSKHEICDALWPKKDDASETLYALISRLKRELDKTSSFDIISDRGRAYILKRRKSESWLSDRLFVRQLSAWKIFCF